MLHIKNRVSWDLSADVEVNATAADYPHKKHTPALVLFIRLFPLLDSRGHP